MSGSWPCSPPPSTRWGPGGKQAAWQRGIPQFRTPRLLRLPPRGESPVGAWPRSLSQASGRRAPVVLRRATHPGRSWPRLPDWARRISGSPSQGPLGAAQQLQAADPGHLFVLDGVGAIVWLLLFKGEDCDGVFSAPSPRRASVLQLLIRVRPGTCSLAPWKGRAGIFFL